MKQPSAEQYARTEALKMVMAKRSPSDLITESVFGIADRLAHYILTGQDRPKRQA